jgi:hypothetical protein
MAEKKSTPNDQRETASPKEKLLKFRAVSPFSDGNLREAMEKYGYKVEWPTNEVRALPSWLIQRCMQSGAELDRADG